MGKVKQVEQMIIRNFENELKIKFIEIEEVSILKKRMGNETFQKGLNSFPIIFSHQMNEIHDKNLRIRKLTIVGVKNTAIETAIEYKATTNKGSYFFEIGFKILPMHTLH